MMLTLPIARIVSGGQTGVDRAALDWAIAHGLPHGGWCPQGRRAADGILDRRYLLRETESPGYRQRTRRNVEDSDATLIVNQGELTGGSLLTRVFAGKLGKPWRVIQLEADLAEQVAEVRRWLVQDNTQRLNVAGPSEGRCPGIGAATLRLLDLVFAQAPA